jgi:hypothetical protein
VESLKMGILKEICISTYLRKLRMDGDKKENENKEFHSEI